MYTVLDFEFNQGFEFDTNPTAINPNCRFEIIQIGAVKVNENFEIIDKFNIYIKPVIYKRLHPYVEKITGIKPEMLKNATNFTDAFNQFKKFIGDSKILCIWGSSDLRALYRNMNYYNMIENSLILEYIDVQQLTTKYLKYSKGGTIGLKNAVNALGLNEEEDFHNALNDAIYTARVFAKICDKQPTIKIFNSKHIPKPKPAKVKHKKNV